MPNQIAQILAEIRNDLAKLSKLVDVAAGAQTPKDSEETIWKRLSAKWDLLQATLIVFTIVFTLLTIVFTVIGVLSAVNLSDINRTVRETQNDFNGMRTQTNDLVRQTQQLVSDAVSSSEALSNLAEGDTFVSEGYRELERKEFGSALAFASEAISMITPALRLTGVYMDDLTSASRYDPEHCDLDPQPPPLLCEPLIPSSGSKQATEKLRPAICEALFAARDLHAKATTFAGKTAGLTDDAKTLMILFHGRPQGYHWMGIAEEYSGPDHYDDATKCFNASIHQDVHQTDDSRNVDSVNLAELEFVLGNYANSRRFAKDYLSSAPDSYGNGADILAQFYLALAELVGGVSTEATGIFRKRFGSLKDVVAGTFSPFVLKKYLQSSQFLNLPSERRQEIKKTTDCLTDKQCQ
jgi:hypothetical protein